MRTFSPRINESNSKLTIGAVLHIKDRIVEQATLFRYLGPINVNEKCDPIVEIKTRIVRPEKPF